MSRVNCCQQSFRSEALVSWDRKVLRNHHKLYTNVMFKLSIKNRFICTFIPLFLISCSEFTPNEQQVNTTKENLECYKSLINELKSDENLRAYLIEIRDSKLRDESDPIFVEQNFRLISPDEFQNVLPENWKNSCSIQLKEDNDLRGIRYISQNSIVIEVDKFNRHTLSERYSRTRTTEIHRILVSDNGIKNASFRFRSERIMFQEKFENGWTYQISQMDKN